MEYVYAALLVHETGEEPTEDNITDVIEAAGAEAEPSRVKALVAALGDVDIEEALETAAAVPAGAGGAAAPAQDAEPDDAGEEAEATEEPEADEGDDDDNEADGEGLGNLFG